MARFKLAVRGKSYPLLNQIKRAIAVFLTKEIRKSTIKDSFVLSGVSGGITSLLSRESL